MDHQLPEVAHGPSQPGLEVAYKVPEKVGALFFRVDIQQEGGFC